MTTATVTSGTCMHVFDHTIKPILLYGCEVWGMLNPFTSKFRNTLLNFSRIFDKLPAEKLHQTFCKYILGVHSKTSNTAVLSELGRFPIYFNIVKALVKYYYRLKTFSQIFQFYMMLLRNLRSCHIQINPHGMPL